MIDDFRMVPLINKTKVLLPSILNRKSTIDNQYRRILCYHYQPFCLCWFWELPAALFSARRPKSFMSMKILALPLLRDIRPLPIAVGVDMPDVPLQRLPWLPGKHCPASVL
jgi:hypothetical protein